ncbi:MAG: BREX-1 system adenine-specific DNA-methyltransferase PglX [Bacteroidaceae bacterium]|nr:BREX-1 system adenine-specific DNA-methyltransferase PglX [Bacteroidaceae bacterium]
MNKTAIKNFAIWARNKLIADIRYKAGLLGITDKEIKSPLPQSTKDVQFFDIGTKEPYSIIGVEIEQRRKLAEAIQAKEYQSDYRTAYKGVIEEVAYTWFNRLIAVRFMEVNDYLPTHIRVLSSESSMKIEPDLVTSPFEANLNYTPFEKDRIMQLKNDNQLDDLFCMLFIKQCNALNAILPELFENTNDYTELLMNVSFTDKDGVVYHLVHDIQEYDFKEAVEIIGWMYQYYISEKHAEVINVLGGKTIKKEDIPAATQLFTTDWVVRYMVDNSLGRYWLERNPNSKLKEKLGYFATPKNEKIKSVNEKVDPKDLAFFDPCMGSGHILVYAFDVLMEIYRECGYSDRDAAVYILTNNIYGLDIDDRAYQLAYFAIMMKARSYNRRVLTMEISPNVCAIQESNILNRFTYEGITNDEKQNIIGDYLIEAFKHAKEIGSLLSVELKDYNSFSKCLFDCEAKGQIDLFSSEWLNNTMPLMRKLAKQADIMSKKYAVVCTNPPYMNKLESHLKKFVTTQYKPYSGDLFSVFMYRNFNFCMQGGYSAFMTPNVWMFIKSYEKLREHIISQRNISSLIQMAKGAFFKEATVDICTFVLENRKTNENGIYIRLEDFKGDMDVQKQKVLEALANKNCGYFYETNDENFSKIPGMPIAYWVENGLRTAFSNTLIGDLYDVRQGMTTSDNNRFLRLWYEVADEKSCYICKDSSEAVSSQLKWFAYNKGGDFRKWYGNKDYVVNYFNNGQEMEEFHAELNKTSSGGRLKSREFYFKESITWSFISSSKFGVRYSNEGSIFDVAGSSLFPDHKNIYYVTGLLCSNVAYTMLNVINPTLNYQAKDIKSLPLIISQLNFTEVNDLVQNNISISKTDWDSFETSWDFKKHPLLKFEGGSVKCEENNSTLNFAHSKLIKISYKNWQAFTESQFAQLKANEEDLNRIFIDIYGLQDELMPEVEEKDVTIRKAELSRDIRSFVSYAVGCMLGRYSLDVNGLAYAGGKWDESKYKTFIPDKDNIIPITDEEYFEDDVVGLFCAFLKKTFGAETLEENLDFIAKALGNKGDSSREIIRNYFLKDFFINHCKIYQKRPIYWLFDSGKADGFKALIYMHRYNEDTIGNLRIDYLHRMQRVYESEISRMQETIENSGNAREVAAATKRKEKLTKQLKEAKEYDEKITHLALARIAIDLDDGVKINYEKVQSGTDGKKLDVLAKI